MQLSWWESFKGKLSPVGLTPGVLVGECLRKYVVFSIIVPVFFAIVTIKKINLVSPSDRRDIISYIDYFWPPFSSQFSEIARVSGAEVAENYMIFFLTLFATYFGFIVFSLMSYSKVRRGMSGPQFSDIALLAICLIGWVYAIFLDYPKLNPKPLNNFYVDVFGLYFFRQWFVFVGAGFGPVLLLIMLRKTIDKVSMRLGRESKT